MRSGSVPTECAMSISGRPVRGAGVIDPEEGPMEYMLLINVEGEPGPAPRRSGSR